MNNPSSPSAAAHPPIAATPAVPWWRVGMVWVVVAGPLSVLLASAITVWLAWSHRDTVIVNTDAAGVSAQPPAAADAASVSHSP